MIFFIPGFISSLVFGIKRFMNIPSIWQPFFIGLIIGGVLYHTLLKRWHWLSCFEHELGHALASILLLRKITYFKATAHNGGLVNHSGGSELGNDFIGLAPYFLPTFTVIAILVMPFLPSSWNFWKLVFIGITYYYFIPSSVDEFKLNYSKRMFRNVQGRMTNTDIATRGYIFSTIFIVGLASALHGMIFVYLSGGLSSLPEFFSIAWETSIEFYKPLFMRLHNLIN